MKNVRKVVFLFCRLAACTGIALLISQSGARAFAETQAESQAKSYHYSSIVTTLRINTDSTIDAEEDQTFSFIGEFHAAERDIPLQGVDAITDVSVTDAATGEPLAHSSGSPDKLNPQSWNSFSYHVTKNVFIIAWYYNLADTTHEWIVKYKIHGAVSFGSAYDRLYWNIFSNYTVPIDQASVAVLLPESLPSQNVQFTAYRGSEKPFHQTLQSAASSTTFAFDASAFDPREAFTIDVAWPKGVVSERAYWLDFLHLYWAAILGGAAAIICFLTGLLWWLKVKFEERHGTIIPQYEPPKGLRPAAAEFIVKEKTTDKGLAATIVDLAVRGYIKIAEDDGTGRRKDYTVSIMKDFAGDSDIKPYEKEYLQLLFSVGDGTQFRTRELKLLSRAQIMIFQKKFREIKKNIEDQVIAETGAFRAVPKVRYGVGGVLFIFAFISAFVAALGQAAGFLPFVIILASIGGLIVFIKNTIRRSPEGKILRDEWLGFKMYLQVAEGYRLQNLTPDLFEKYLPYAMMFGIEKQWAHVFESGNIQIGTPVWYVGISGTTGGFSTGGGFSPGAFSASFSSSFSSAFASVTGTGGGGGFGGGSAGGGGGGGGGGAS